MSKRREEQLARLRRHPYALKPGTVLPASTRPAKPEPAPSILTISTRSPLLAAMARKVFGDTARVVKLPSFHI